MCHLRDLFRGDGTADDGSSAASARETPRVSKNGGGGENDPMLLDEVVGGLGDERGRRVEEEDEEGEGKRQGSAVEFWGREYSSFTHRRIMMGVKVNTSDILPPDSILPLASAPSIQISNSDPKLPSKTSIYPTRLIPIPFCYFGSSYYIP